MEKPKILCSANAAWCTANKNAALAMTGATGYVGGTAAGVFCNIPALVAAKVSFAAL